MIDKRINIARDIINIFHHCSWAVDDEKFIPQQLLSPPFQLMNTPIVFQNFLNNIEIKYTVKQCPPPQTICVIVRYPSDHELYHQQMNNNLSRGPS